MKTALYAGSFNPFHKGHDDILNKALKVFDKVIIARYGKQEDYCCWDKEGLIAKPIMEIGVTGIIGYRMMETIKIVYFEGLLVDLIKDLKPDALIRGLRNGNDLQYEMNQLYWNEDLGITVPTIYFICDRTLGHISSSAIRELNNIKEDNNV